VDPELEFIEQVGFQQRLPEKTVAVNDEVFASLLLEFGPTSVATSPVRVPINIASLAESSSKAYFSASLSK
jgi:hypothetical protein